MIAMYLLGTVSVTCALILDKESEPHVARYFEEISKMFIKHLAKV